MLRPAGERAFPEIAQNPHHELRAEFGEAIVQLPCRLVGADGGALHKADGAGIELLLDAHDRHAGLGIAGEKCALNGRRAPPARQKRGMDVEAAIARRIEDRLRQDLPIGHHHAGVGVERLEARLLLRASQACRRMHRKPLALGEELDRRFARGEARGRPRAAAGCRRLRPRGRQRAPRQAPARQNPACP